MVFNVSGMTIWILAILLLAAVGAAGYQQGAIRGAVNFVGIILAAMLAGLAGKIFVPLMGLFGVKNPIWLWVLPPFLGFLLLMALVKTGAFFLHRKIDVYYKYKAGDLRLALWERLNARVGISVGLLNGVAYLVLLAFVINAFSYWTIQMSSTESDPKAMRVLNALGRDLQSTGMHRVGRAIDPLATPFYDTADLAGLRRSLVSAEYNGESLDADKWPELVAERLLPAWLRSLASFSVSWMGRNSIAVMPSCCR